MKQLLFTLYITIFLLSCASKETLQKQALLQQTANKTYTFEFGELYTEIDPNKGGRVISYKLGDFEMLTQVASDTFSYGSTFWPSPQANWQWPPPFTLDRGKFSTKQSNDTLFLQSEIDSRTGLSLAKAFFIAREDTALHIIYTLKNERDTTLMVAPWEITRVPKGGLFFFELGSEAIIKKNPNPVPVKRENLKEGVIMYFEDHGKDIPVALLGTWDGNGWLAYAYKEYVFLKVFPDIKSSDFPPKEAEVLYYISPKGMFSELENQGAYKPIRKGETLKWEVSWYLRKSDLENKLNIEKLKILVSNLKQTTISQSK